MPLTAIAIKTYGGGEDVRSINDVLAEAAVDPWYPVPYSVLASMKETEMEDRRSGISVTQLLGSGCTRCNILKRYEGYTEGVPEIMARWRGTIFHEVLEKHPIPGSITELRLRAPIPGGKLAGEASGDVSAMDDVVNGRFDVILPHLARYGGAVLLDLKNPKEVPMYDKVWDDHREQLNFYRWLVNHAVQVDWEQVDVYDVALKLGLDPGDYGDSIELEEAAIQGLRNLTFRSIGIWYAGIDKIKPLEVRERVQVPTKAGAKNDTKTMRVSDVWSDEKVESLLVPRYWAMKEALLKYEATGELPPYPLGVDPLPHRFWPHRYSAVANKCMELWFKEGR